MDNILTGGWSMPAEPRRAMPFGHGRAPPPTADEAGGAWWQSSWLWLAIALISALPILVPPFPMMPDYFNHVGRYHIMNFGDRSALLPRYYMFEWRLIGNLGVDLIMVPLGRLFGTEPGARIATALIPMLSVAGLFALSRAVHGRVQVGAVLALPLVWNMDLAFGFANYCLGTAAAMLAGAWWIRCREVGNRPSPLLVAVVGMVVWLCHLMGWGLLGVIVGSYEVVRGVRRGAPPHRIVLDTMAVAWPLLVPIAAIAAGLWLGAGTQTVPGDPIRMSALAEKLLWVRSVVRNVFARLDVASVALIGVATILLFCWGEVRRHSWGLLIAGAAMVICFLLFPPVLMGSAYADQRLLAPAGMLLLVAAGPIARRRATILAVAALALFAARLAVLTYEWDRSGARLAQDLALLDRVPRGARIAVGAPSSGCLGWARTVFDTAPSLAIVRREAFVNTEWNFTGYFLLFPRWTAGIDPLRVDTNITTPTVPCRGDTVRDFLTALPRERFTHVWLFAVPEEKSAPWLRKIGAGPDSFLYRIDGAAPPA